MINSGNVANGLCQSRRPSLLQAALHICTATMLFVTLVTTLAALNVICPGYDAT